MLTLCCLVTHVVGIFIRGPGEVFVLDDGGEVDLDLGNYERFLDIRLTKENNLTTGKIYQSVINKERKGDYLGKTVQGESACSSTLFVAVWFAYCNLFLIFILWPVVSVSNELC